ncbi:hypothetical protein Tco_1557903 [Tanacetum coccineum]
MALQGNPRVADYSSECPYYGSDFTVVTSKGLLGWHSNWMWVDVSKTRMPLECVRWRTIVNLDSQARPYVPSDDELNLGDKGELLTVCLCGNFHGLSIDQKVLCFEVEDILYMVVLPNNYGVNEHSE